jgi:hypothetical protein
MDASGSLAPGNALVSTGLATFRVVGNPDCDLKAVGMIVWQGGNRSDRASHRT